MIIMIQGKYRLLAHTLLVIMLLHLMYSLTMRILLTSQVGSDAEEQFEVDDLYSNIESLPADFESACSNE